MKDRHFEFKYLRLEDVYGDENIIFGLIANAWDHKEQVAFYYSKYDGISYILDKDTTSISYAKEVKDNGLLAFITDRLETRNFKTYHMNFVA